MKIDKIRKLSRKADYINAGADYLRLKLEEPNEFLENKMNMLDFDNSNNCTIKFSDVDLSGIKLQLKNWNWILFTMPYKWFTVPIFIYMIYTEEKQKFNWCYWKLDLYGTYFRLIDIDYMFEWSVFNLQWDKTFSSFINRNFHYCNITRIDWRVDFFYKDKNKKIFLPKDVTTLKQNTKVNYDVIWERVTWRRLGDRKNKNYFIRWYDKLLDSEKKGKISLYADYFDFEQVYRLEYEFLNHFCKPATLAEHEKLHDKIKNFFHTDKLTFSHYKTKDKTILKDKFERLKYAKMAKSYIKGCVQAWINIFWMLHDIFDDLWLDKKQIDDIFDNYKKRNDYYFYYE